MSDVLLTIHCAPADADVVIGALRRASTAAGDAGRAMWQRDEQRHGSKLDGAGTAELVAGALRRTAVELIVARADVPTLLVALGDCRRRHPLSWRSVDIDDHGEIG